MIDGYYEVTLECTDGFLSELDMDDIVERAKMLCEVFDFTFKPDIQSTDVASVPNLRFSIVMYVKFLTYQHYLNVLMAFAQEFQLSISSARPLEEPPILDLNTLSLPADA